MNDIQTKLLKIQSQIKAPKNLYNSFGKYKYRNFESICEAAKPYLLENNCSMTVSDEIVAVGDRIYVKATVTLTDCESGNEISVSALAREAEDKKGMDSSQVTGSTSSYARKYAVNGLFLLDDTKDADSEEYHTESEGRASLQSSKPAAQQSNVTPPPAILSNEDKVKFDAYCKEMTGYIEQGLMNSSFQQRFRDIMANKDLHSLENGISFMRKQAAKTQNTQTA